MKPLLIAWMVGGLALPGLAQGTLRFANKLTSLVDARVVVGLGTGSVPADGRYVAQLYAAPLGLSPLPIGMPMAFLDTPAAGQGYLPDGGAVVVPGVPAGSPAHVKLVAWAAALGDNYDQARAYGLGFLGESEVLTVVTGGADPAPLVGLQGFTIGAIPEGPPPPHPNAPPVPWSGNGHYYQRVAAANISWVDARTAARELSYQGFPGHLVTINSADEAAFIQDDSTLDWYATQLDRCWIGAMRAASDSGPTVGWLWVTGEPFVFSAWAVGEPRSGVIWDSAAWFTNRVATTGRRAWSAVPAAMQGSRGYLVEYESEASPGQPPIITRQPTNQTVAVGGTATFTVVASGDEPLSYQWIGSSLSQDPSRYRTTEATLVLTNVQVELAGHYFVIVTNRWGLVSSSSARLEVTFAPAIQAITNRVVVSTVAGSGIRGFADGPGTNAAFSSANGLAVDRSGNVYVADFKNTRIRKVTPAGMVSAFAGADWGYVDGPLAQSRFKYPTELCFDPVGTLFVVEQDPDLVRRIGVDGTVTTVAGAAGYGYADGPGTSARFNGPSGVAVDNAGNLYVVDYGNHAIRRIAPDGRVTTWVGNGTAGESDGPRTTARLSGPERIAIDAAGNLYVSESNTGRIRRVDAATGEVVTWVGRNGLGYQDGPLAGARLNRGATAIPLAVDNAGNLWVGDNGNQAVRRITPAGQVETVASGLTASGLAAASERLIYATDLVTLRRIEIEQPPGVPPTLTLEPEDLTALEGSTVSLAVSAAGTPVLHYQWQTNTAWGDWGVEMHRKDAAELVLTDIRPSLATGYRVIVSNAYGAVTSRVAILTVESPTNRATVAWSVNGHGYLRVDRPGISWLTARAEAETLTWNGIPGHLVTCGSSEENRFVTEHAQLGNGMADLLNRHWIGAYQPADAAEPSDDWRWVTGESFSYRNWSPQEPNDEVPGEDTAMFNHLFSDGGKQWNDAPEDYAASLGYVVEFEPATLRPPAMVAFATKASGVDARVSSSQGAGLEPVGQEYLGQLYWGLMPLGVPVPFRESPDPAKGYITSGGNVEISGVAAGSVVELKLVAWHVSRGATYEDAQCRNLGGFGESLPVPVTTGGGLMPPASLLGLSGFVIPSNLAPPPPNAGPVRIVQEPARQTTPPGGNVTFSVSAQGLPPLDIQWFRGLTPIPAAQAPSLVLTNVQAADVGLYSVVVSNRCGAVRTREVVLQVVGAAPSLLVNGDFEEPKVGVGEFGTGWAAPDQSLVPGWRTTATDGRIELWDGHLMVLPSYAGAQHAEVNAYMQAALYQDVAGIGAGAQLGFRFAHRGRTGPETLTLVITDLGRDGASEVGDDTILFRKDYTTDDTGWTVYTSAPESPIVALGNRVRVAFESQLEGSLGNLLDAVEFGPGVALLHPGDVPPIILTEPEDLDLAVGDTASLRVVASSSTPLGYRWARAEMPILLPTVTTSSLDITNAQPSDAGHYFVVITNAYGTVVSHSAEVTVAATPRPRLVAASSRYNPTQVSVVFSIPVDATSATRLGNYCFSDGSPVLRALLIAPDTVVLQTALTRPGWHELTVNDVRSAVPGGPVVARDSKVAFALTDGQVQWEIFDEVSDDATLDTVLEDPRVVRGWWNRAGLFTAFEFPTDDQGARLLGRLRAFVYPPVTGAYRFWLWADDVGVVFLSPDDDPAHKRPIVRLDQRAEFRDYTVASEPIQLEQGRRYYLEAIHLERDDRDGLGVAWQLPGGPPPTPGDPPISGEFLASLRSPGPPTVNLVPTLIEAVIGQPLEIRVSEADLSRTHSVVANEDTVWRRCLCEQNGDERAPDGGSPNGAGGN